jgi:hypothetical protein
MSASETKIFKEEINTNKQWRHKKPINLSPSAQHSITTASERLQRILQPEKRSRDETK